MKNAREYERKLKKLLRGSLKKSASPPVEEDKMRLLLRGVLEPDTLAKDTSAAMDALTNEFVDYNELRVAPLKDIVECIGKKFPGAWDKAQILHTATNRIFERRFEMSLDYLQEMGKRDLRRYLLEIDLGAYAAAYLVLMGFDGHAIPVDQSLVDALADDDCIYPGSDAADVQGFLERVISQRDAVAAHRWFRSYVEKTVKAAAKRRQAAAAAEAAAEEKTATPRKTAKTAAKATKPPAAKATKASKPAKGAKKVRPSAKTAKTKSAPATRTSTRK